LFDIKYTKLKYTKKYTKSILAIIVMQRKLYIQRVLKNSTICGTV